MKLHLIAPLLAAALVAIAAPRAHAASAVGADFHFALKGESFQFDLKMYFDPSLSLDEVRSDLKDTSLFPQLSDLITDLEQDGPDSGYYLTATAKKFHISQTNVTYCRDTSGNGTWNQDCTLALSRGNTSRYWVWGSNFIHCAVVTTSVTQVMCHLHSEGQPKGIHIPLIITRTPQQLALAGAGQSIRDYGSLMHYADERLSPSDAQDAYEGSTLAQLQNRLYSEGRSMSDDGLSDGQTLVIDGSDRTGSFTIGAQ